MSVLTDFHIEKKNKDKHNKTVGNRQSPLGSQRGPKLLKKQYLQILNKFFKIINLNIILIKSNTFYYI